MRLMMDDLMSPDFSDLSHIRCHTGGIFRFGQDLQIFTKLHAYSHLRDVHRDDYLSAIFMMIPQWSLYGTIQPSPHFSAFGCCHASYSGRRSLDVWI